MSLVSAADDNAVIFRGPKGAEKAIFGRDNIVGSDDDNLDSEIAKNNRKEKSKKILKMIIMA